MLKFIRRKLTAKGHGVHSPFAFYFITKILGDKLIYNHFSDIENRLLKDGIDLSSKKKYRLFFKIVNFAQPESILQIGTQNGIESLYLNSATNARFDLYAQSIDSKKKVLASIPNLHFIDTLSDISQKYDLIYLKQEKSSNISIKKLLDMSNSKSCWIVDSIKFRNIKNNLWEEIKKHPAIKVTFEKKDFGIVFLNRDLHKINYIV